MGTLRICQMILRKSARSGFAKATSDRRCIGAGRSAGTQFKAYGIRNEAYNKAR